MPISFNLNKQFFTKVRTTDVFSDYFGSSTLDTTKWTLVPGATATSALYINYIGVASSLPMSHWYRFTVTDALDGISIVTNNLFHYCPGALSTSTSPYSKMSIESIVKMNNIDDGIFEIGAYAPGFYVDGNTNGKKLYLKTNGDSVGTYYVSDINDDTAYLLRIDVTKDKISAFVNGALKVTTLNTSDMILGSIGCKGYISAINSSGLNTITLDVGMFRVYYTEK